MEEQHGSNDTKSTPCRKLEFEVDDELRHSSIKEQEEHQLVDGLENNDDSKSLVHNNISHELIPYIGMDFESKEEAFDFYNRYAKEVGFSIRKHKGHPDKYGG